MSQHALLSAGCKAWRSLSCPRSELRLDLTLGCGQTFRWRETGDGHWTGVMRGKVWTLTQTEDTLWYYVYSHQINPGTENKQKWKVEEEEQLLGKMSKRKTDMKQDEAGFCTVMSDPDNKEEELLRDYFQLGVKLGDLYRDWSTVDPHFKHTADIFKGVRLLRQDPVECLFSFICSSNNHISRIQGMVDRLCQTLGALLFKLDDVAYHDFPPLQALTDPSVEMHLRDLGFGYRARFLQQSSQIIVNSHDPDWLLSLRSAPYLQARDSLRALPGVGLKVADCVCLMSLDKFEALPVDTHVWQIAKRDYCFAGGSSQKTLTDRVYKEIGDFFRKLWGPYAGWAHSVLFCADLKRFQKLKEEIPALKDEKTELKKKMKERRHDRCEEKQKRKKGKKQQRT
ncbi:N-glycosylase/DNA lyase [Carassius carassius]|uniref:N-glycosylase/DNA lyase n=1 Tax=Carassius carassius TaxID=217509 RepID=UPI00286887F4|nr:N-glycosylase/DNA lyase [Carassius carassius]XP_059359020.1 N-glycosylase/DNA lyase [Carassius carassius]XP_059359021.1 N-glycosylase/DNA lyase [Carassius carassius]